MDIILGCPKLSKATLIFKNKTMKNVRSFGKLLTRSQMHEISGSGYETINPNGISGGGGQCSQTGCESKSSGDGCIINGSSGTCRMGSCAGTRQLLCYTT